MCLQSCELDTIEYEIVEVGQHVVAFLKLLDSDLAISNAPNISKALLNLCDEESFDFLVVDMSNVIYIDSSGVGALLTITSKLGRDVIFFHDIQESAKKVLRLMHIVGFFGIYACKNLVTEHLRAQS
jgi:anti-anti-sigma factor